MMYENETKDEEEEIVDLTLSDDDHDNFLPKNSVENEQISHNFSSATPEIDSEENIAPPSDSHLQAGVNISIYVEKFPPTPPVISLSPLRKKLRLGQGVEGGNLEKMGSESREGNVENGHENENNEGNNSPEPLEEDLEDNEKNAPLGENILFREGVGKDIPEKKFSKWGAPAKKKFGYPPRISG